MRRIALLALLGLCMAVGGHAADSKPPWQRLLQAEDAKRVKQLDEKLDALRSADKYAEAIATARDIVALRTRVQGQDHWQTADAQRLLKTLEQVAAIAGMAFFLRPGYSMDGSPLQLQSPQTLSRHGCNPKIIPSNDQALWGEKWLVAGDAVFVRKLLLTGAGDVLDAPGCRVDSPYAMLPHA